MKYAISLVLATFIVCSIGYGLQSTVIKTHDLEQRNE